MYRIIYILTVCGEFCGAFPTLDAASREYMARVMRIAHERGSRDYPLVMDSNPSRVMSRGVTRDQLEDLLDDHVPDELWAACRSVA